MSFIIIISLLRFFFIIITTIYYYLLIIAIPWLCFIFLLNTMRYTAKKSDTRNVFMLYRLYQQQCCQLGLKIWDKKLPKFDLQKSSQSWKHWSVVASFFDQPFPSSVCHFLAFDQKVPDWLYDISSIFNHTISICSFDLNYHHKLQILFSFWPQDDKTQIFETFGILSCLESIEIALSWLLSLWGGLWPLSSKW